MTPFLLRSEALPNWPHLPLTTSCAEYIDMYKKLQNLLIAAEELERHLHWHDSKVTTIQVDNFRPSGEDERQRLMMRQNLPPPPPPGASR